MVVHLVERFKLTALTEEVTRLVTMDPVRAQDCPEALGLFVGDSVSPGARKQLQARNVPDKDTRDSRTDLPVCAQHLLYWSPVPVPEALRFLFPKFSGDAILLQYALRVLEHHPVSVTFFYVPQVVQALRTDELGYAERFIFETCADSSLPRPVRKKYAVDFSMGSQVQDFTAVLPPNYLEYEGERVPRRQCGRGTVTYD